MTTSITVRKPSELKKAYQRIANGIQGPFKSTRRMFMLLGSQIDRDTVLTFKRKGNIPGREKWLEYNWGQGASYKGTKTFPSSTRNRGGLYKKRPGTDNAKTRRFSASSKLLQASGGFRNSFKIINVGLNKMTYGSQHKLAGKIGSRPTRQVLWYTRQDQSKYTDLILKWWFKNTKI